MSNCHLVAVRSLSDLAASRLALRAPALRAATVLTRPNRSAQRLPCGRHTVPTAMTVGPNNIVTNHCVERGDHLTHYRHDRDLRLLSGGLEPVVERLEGRIPIAGAQRCHVEHLAHVCAAAPDAAPTPERAALEGVRRNTSQSSDLFAIHAAELGQERDQRAGQQRSDSRHRGEQSVAAGENGICCNYLEQALVQHLDVGGEPPDTSTRKTPQYCLFQQSGSILSGGFLGAELAADSKRLDQLLGGRRRPLRWTCRHDADED